MRRTPSEPIRFLDWALARLRWATIVALLLLTIVQPAVGRAGLPTWGLVLLFVAVDMLCRLLHRLQLVPRSFARQAIVDLVAASLVYSLSPQPGGPPFVLVVLAVVCAAAGLPPRGTLLYTAAAAAMVAVVEPTLPQWSPPSGDVRELGTRVVGLAVVGVGATILARRLDLEHEAAQASRGEAERLAELDRLRASFVAAVSHDLQTPLAAARVSLGLLGASAGDRLRPEEQGLLDAARRNNQRLGLLIDDLLALNQLEAGTLRLDRDRIDLRAVVTDAVATLRPLLDDRGQVLDIDLPTPLPVVGDARRLGQVVANLLHNAHRHTPPGTRVVISGRAAPDDILLTVRDDGPGIAPEALEAVFRRSHRLATHGEGSGLGLAIARELVELHRGRIWAEAGLGQGTAFHVALPRSNAGDAS